MNEKYYLRSTGWFGKDDKMGLVHWCWLRNQKQPDLLFLERLGMSIFKTWSDLTHWWFRLRSFTRFTLKKQPDLC